jgi:hypothetical protein
MRTSDSFISASSGTGLSSCAVRLQKGRHTEVVDEE